jgi:hypothetical protein
MADNQQKFTMLHETTAAWIPQHCCTPLRNRLITEQKGKMYTIKLESKISIYVISWGYKENQPSSKFLIITFKNYFNKALTMEILSAYLYLHS